MTKLLTGVSADTWIPPAKLFRAPENSPLLHTPTTLSLAAA